MEGAVVGVQVLLSFPRLCADAAGNKAELFLAESASFRTRVVAKGFQWYSASVFPPGNDIGRRGSQKGTKLVYDS